jgi:hypothetical protein
MQYAGRGEVDRDNTHGCEEYRKINMDEWLERNSRVVRVLANWLERF